MTKTAVYSYIAATMMLWCAWTGSVAATEPYTVNLGDFKCPQAPENNRKIAIFKLVIPDVANGATEFDDDGEETEHYNTVEHQPKLDSGRFFCITVDKNRNSATWNDLTQGVDIVGQKLVPTEWGNEDVIRQFYVDDEWKDERQADGTGYGWNEVMGSSDANDEPDDNDVMYHFAQTCLPTFLYGCGPLSEQEANLAPRVRFYFYGIPSDEGHGVEQAFVYFMKIAEKEDYPAPDDPSASSTPSSNSGGNTSSSTGGTSNLSEYARRLNLLQTTDLSQFVGMLIRGVLGIIGTIALIMIIYGGVLWMTARGNSETQTKAQNTIVWATLGVALIFASYALVGFIFEIFK